jgi:PAS domain S-box-containing protein
MNTNIDKTIDSEKILKLIKEYKKNIILEYLKKSKTLLESNHININYFLTSYVSELFESFATIVKDNNIQNTKWIFDRTVTFFMSKNLNSNELFKIYNNLGQSILTILKEKLNIDEIIAINNCNNIIYEYIISTTNVSFSTDKLKTLYELIDKEIIMSKTDKHGIIQNVSTAFCKISGYSKDELIGKHHNIVKHPSMPNNVFKELWETIKNGKTWTGDILNKNKEGNPYWVSAKIMPEFDKNNQIIGYVAIRQDITDKKEIEKQNEIIGEQSKAAAVGEMISMIAHQWRQPLQVIAIISQKLSLDFMINGNQLEEEELNLAINSITEQLSYMSQTIDDFREFLKPEKEMKLIEVNVLMQKSVDFLSTMVKNENIKIEIKNSTEPIFVKIHINEVKQVLINIIKNSIDQLKENQKNSNKTIILSANEKYLKNETVASLTIQDNGGGIPQENIQRIFEPYFSTKSKNGTGLGLYMAKKIITQHKGSDLFATNEYIEEGNEKSIGACFHINLKKERQ